MKQWEQKVVEVIADAVAGHMADQIIREGFYFIPAGIKREHFENVDTEKVRKYFGMPKNRMQRYDNR